MKSPLNNQSESEKSEAFIKFSQLRSRRFVTLPDTASTFYKNNPSLYLGQTPKRILTKSVSMTHQQYKLYQSRKNCQSTTRRPPNKHRCELVNNMSNKRYGNIVAYGWVHLKVHSQPKDQLYFSINLSNIKNFLLVQIQGDPGAKIIAQQYQIQLTELVEKQVQVTKQIIKTAIQKTLVQIYGKRQKISNIKNKLSIVSVVAKEEEIIVAGIGDLSVLCFTKQQQLINANEANYQTLNQNQKFLRYFNKVRNNDIRQKAINRNKKYTLLNYKFSFNEFDQVDETQVNRVKIRTLKSSNIIWIGIFSKNITKNCPKHYIKQCINKQFSQASTTYHYNQIAKQSSNKIINSLTSKDMAKQMTSIVIFLKQYPVQKETSEGKFWNEPRVTGRFKTFKDKKQLRHIETNENKLFKYVGNRNSFVKSITTCNKITVKPQVQVFKN